MQSHNAKIIELMFEVGRLMKGNMGVESHFANLSMLQMQALLFLASNPNSTMSEIAKHFSIELPSATSLINKLHKQELIARQEDKEDRRKICIVLTEKGVELLKEGKKIRSQKMEAALSYLTDTDKQDMEKILEKVVRALGDKHE